MKKIGLFYVDSAHKTSLIVKMLVDKLGKDNVELVKLETATQKDVEKYSNLIFGAATWFDGELPLYWDEIIPAVEGVSMKGKRVAIFGLGDQANYPENFVDSIGLLAKLVEKCKGQVVGYTSNKDYKYERSIAENDAGDQFMGLALDFENQKDKNEERISNWVEQLRKEFQ